MGHHTIRTAAHRAYVALQHWRPSVRRRCRHTLALALNGTSASWTARHASAVRDEAARITREVI